MVKNLPALQETWVQSLDQEDSLHEGMAAYSSILAWRTPWTEGPAGYSLCGLKRVGHDLTTKQQYILSNIRFVKIMIKLKKVLKSLDED